MNRTGLTGATYKHWDHGRVPVEAQATIERMESRGLIACAHRSHFGRQRETYFALVEPSTERIKDQLELVLEVIRENRDLNASEIREKSHEFIGYDLTQRNDVIPYETAAYVSEALSENDIAAVRRLNAEFGWTESLA